MSINPDSYGFHPAVPEAYDRHETQTGDIELLRRLLTGLGSLRILEPFCGTGRILIPLALDGHQVVGLDMAEAMLSCARAKIAVLPLPVQQRIGLVRGDATVGDWPGGFDVVVLGGNCFYEVASAEEQKGCIASAARALKSGGHLFADSDHMEGPLPESWTRPGVHETRWPSGVLADGSMIEGTAENLDCDADARIWRARRTITIRHPGGAVSSQSFVQQKHPVSFGEVAGWLQLHGFVVEQTFGDPEGHAYTCESPRATFWARRHGIGRDTK